MQRVWVVVLSVWAMLAVVAVLAWTYRPVAATAGPQVAPQTLALKGAHGKQRFIVVQPATLGVPHATTATSAVPR